MAQTDYAALKKGGFMRQKQKNRFSLRLAVIGGALTAEQLAKLSEVANEYGNGTVHLTSRQGVEIPFVRLEDIDKIKVALAEGNLTPGVCGPRVRTITACQGSAVCPSGNIDTYDIAKKLNDRYFGRELPHKFKFGVTGCRNNCLKAEENDVGVKGALDIKWVKEDCIQCGLCEQVCREKAITIADGAVQVDYDQCNYCGRCAKSCPTDAWETAPAYVLSFGGTFGNAICKGTELVPLVRDEEQLFRVTDAAIGFFAEYAKAGERFAVTIEREGQENLQKRLLEAYEETREGDA